MRIILCMVFVKSILGVRYFPLYKYYVLLSKYLEIRMHQVNLFGYWIQGCLKAQLRNYPWTGPFKVQKKLFECTYQIQKTERRRQRQMILFEAMYKRHLIQKHRINPHQLILQLLQSVVTHRHLSNTNTPTAVGTYLELIDDNYVRVTSWTSWRSIEHNSESATYKSKTVPNLTASGYETMWDPEDETSSGG